MITDSIIQAKKLGASDDNILNEVYKQNPNLQHSIDSARQLALLFKHPQKFIARINEIVNKRELVLGEVLEMESGKIIERSYIPIYRNEEYQGHLWKYTDITERSKAQTVLQITKDKYLSILQNNKYIFHSPCAGRRPEIKSALLHFLSGPW